MLPLSMTLAVTLAALPCATLNGSSTSLLSWLAADDERAIVCVAEMNAAPPSAGAPSPECVVVSLDGGTFAPISGVDGGSLRTWREVDGGRVSCIAGLCESLSATAEGSASSTEADVNPTTLDRVRSLEKQGLVVVESSSGERLATWTPTSKQCPTLVFSHFIGPSVYAFAEGERGSCEWMYTGSKAQRVHWFDDFDCWPQRPRVQLEGARWALASLRPNRIDFVNSTTGARERSVPLHALDWDLDQLRVRLHLGSTVCATTAHTTSPLVKTPGGLLVYVASSGIAIVDPRNASARVLRFPDCAAGGSH